MDIATELAAELEQAFQEALQGGLDEEAAARKAEARVKDWEALARELRWANTTQAEAEATACGTIGAGLWHDSRYAVRAMRFQPGFAAIAILTLVFGIGGNTAIFTVVDHIALPGLPYQQPERLVSIEHTKTDQPEIEAWCSIDNMLDFRRCSRASRASRPYGTWW